MAKAAREVMTSGQLSTYLQIPKSTSYKKAQDGVLPGKEGGRHWRFHDAATNRWLEQELEQKG